MSEPTLPAQSSAMPPTAEIIHQRNNPLMARITHMKTLRRRRGCCGGGPHPGCGCWPGGPHCGGCPCWGGCWPHPESGCVGCGGGCGRSGGCEDIGASHSVSPTDERCRTAVRYRTVDGPYAGAYGPVRSFPAKCCVGTGPHCSVVKDR